MKFECKDQYDLSDFITLIDWVHRSVTQRPYYGWL